MNEAEIKAIGVETNVVAARLHVLSDEAWKLYERLKKQLETADPSSPEGKELELFVIGYGRALPGKSRAADLGNIGFAMADFPHSRKPGVAQLVHEHPALNKQELAHV